MLKLNGHRRSAHKVNRSVTLHPYQQDFVSSVEKSWEEGFRKTLAVLAAGGGKTVCAGELISREVERGGRCLVLVHTIDLVAQFMRSLEDNYGLWCSMDGGGKSSEDSDVVLSTVQSMANRIGKKFQPDDFQMSTVDEAHRVHGGQHLKAVEFFNSRWLGITATPVRTDQKCLMKVFDNKAFDLPITNLINDGYLSPIEVINAPVEIKMASTAKTGDFKEEEIGAALDDHLEACADVYAQHGFGKCGIIFLPLIRTSEKFCGMLRKRGLRVEHIDGTASPEERRRVQRKLEMGELDCVTNSLLWSEGWDCRPLNLLMNLRCTKSWGLQTQIICRISRVFDPAIHGPRGTRWPKKTGATLLDVTWIVDQYNMLQRPASLIAKDENEAEEITKKLKSKQARGEKADLMDALKDVIHDREERLRQRLEAMRNRKSRQVNAMELFLSMDRLDLAEYEPLCAWQRAPITEGQRGFLQKIGFNLDSVKDYGHASLILDEITSRRDAGMATLKMAKFARSLGLSDAFTRKFEEVKEFLDCYQRNEDFFAGQPD